MRQSEMQRGAASRRTSPRSARAATGSVWETRMKLDEVKGGIKVFTEEVNAAGGDEDEFRLASYNLRLRRNKSDGGGGADRRKRKNWSPPETANLPSLNSPKMDDETKEIDRIPDRCSPSEEPVEIIPEKQDLDMEIEGSSQKSSPVSRPERISPEQTEGFDRMQSIVDLIMWREIPRTAFVFGVGSFFLVSSSYTKDLNFSLVSVFSYIGLVYLASIFFFNSVLRRGITDTEVRDPRSMMGEEEAIRIARLLLPYVNELLFNLKALFSGDPETTLKVAVILFILARYGGSITSWTMAKLAFFGVFMIPKICASYSVQLARFGKFWLERVKDGWGTCQHKKAVATCIFALAWNLSSAFVRIWAVFMLMVAVKLYQQRATAAAEEEDEKRWA